MSDDTRLLDDTIYWRNEAEAARAQLAAVTAERDAARALLPAIERKVKTWVQVCDCFNEFGADAEKSCGEMMEQDDEAMLELETIYEDIRRKRGPLPAQPAATADEREKH